MSGYLQNFDLTHGINILRLICGLFFIPHIYAKFFVPEALGFFVAGHRRRARFRSSARCRWRSLESDEGQMAVEYWRL
jgi:hypothetical protein